MTFKRREFLKLSAMQLALASAGTWALEARAADPVLGPSSLPSGVLDASVLEALPGKVPLIKKSFRPPNFETPVSYFEQPFTPNDAFFVRYHLSSIPDVDVAQWKLAIGGESVEKPFELNLDQLMREFEPVELAALCICSGNRRGLSEPHVPGVQWGHGAMGNAKWAGVRLKDVLTRAGLKKDAVEIVFDGADAAAMEPTPDFVKSIPVWKAMDENTMLAWSMNGASLPHWNGYPLRVVVPGWTATYWMKHVTSIRAVAQPFRGFWMATAYRIPKGKFPVVDRFISQETEANTPISEMVVSSLITNLRDGMTLAQGKAAEVHGVSWDGGYGIRDVSVSIDGGASWRPAKLGADLGRFAWRQWSFPIPTSEPGNYVVMAKATNKIGASQTFELVFNPAGYHNNVVERIRISVA